MLITSPPNALTRALYSLSGSMITISASGFERKIDTISSLTINDLPLPGTPSTILLPLRSECLLTNIILLLIAF